MLPLSLFDITQTVSVIAIFLLMVGGTWYLFSRQRQSNNSVGSAGTFSGALTDLTLLACENKIDPVIGRDEEIDRILRVLSRRTKNNVILLGPPGVGKTALAQGLALKIISGGVPSLLAKKRVVSLNVAELLAGTKYRGEFETRVKSLINQLVAAHRSIILFIDEIHTVIETKGAEGAINLADMLKPYLANGDLQLVGATTQKEFEQYIVPDESWSRRFQPILVDEPTIKETIEILEGLKGNYEKYHGVIISDEAVRAAAYLSHEYIKNRYLPDKAIDVIDEASAMVNLERSAPHRQAVGLLHGAARRTAQEKKSRMSDRTVGKEEIRKVISQWIGVSLAHIH